MSLAAETRLPTAAVPAWPELLPLFPVHSQVGARGGDPEPVLSQ